MRWGDRNCPEPAWKPTMVADRSQRHQKKTRYLLDSGFITITGAGEMNRTPDLLITNELLYRLSYTGEASDFSSKLARFCRC